MLECLIIGDSIAVGMANARRDCDNIAMSGINSSEFNRRYLASNKLTGGYSTVVISLGTNDWDGKRTLSNLVKLRKTISAERVMWVLPSAKLKPNERAAVLEVAGRSNDEVIDVPNDLLGKDGIHMTGKGYGVISNGF